MQEKKCNPLTDNFILQFLYEAQSHSGLPYMNKISIGYLTTLLEINVPDDLLDYVMDTFLNNYMIVSHNLYNKTKSWKSYDW